jgi:DNA-binding beta-propeller fold protein YncE
VEVVMKSRAWMCVAALLCFVPLPCRAAPAEAGGYRVIKSYKLGGEGGWDILTIDPDAHRLYYGRGTRVQVLDVNSGKLVGEVPDTPGVHGVALAPDLGRGFTSNGRDSSVTIFDLKTLATLGKIRLDARNPDFILYEPVSKRVFAFNGGSGNATAIDAATGTVVGAVALGGKPEFAVEDGRGRVFVNLEDSSAVVEFEAKSLTLESRWPLAPGEEPSGLAMDRVHRRLFAGCGNQRMVVVDADSGRVVTTLPIGKGVDGTAFDPATRLVFSSNGEGTLSVIHEDSPEKFSVVGEVPTQRGARTMALDEKRHRIYLAAASFGEPPAPTEEHPHPRPPMVPGSFVILVLERGH